jgi:N-acetyl-1-D-myo-inositol-2-amino-2-deoxy-alpha-D-glucopyranoside deacetylase
MIRGIAYTSPMVCVVGLFAHPDDEAYAAGGMLARCAAEGARVVVVSATRGEAGSDRAGDVSPGPAMARLRSRELGDACACIGAEAPRFLELADGSVDPNAGAERLAPLLQELAADVVFTMGPDGAYGHRDHLATTAMLGRVADGRRVLHSAFELDLFAGLHRRLRRLPMVATVERMGVPDDEVDLVLELDDELRRRKLAAIAAHRSQLVGGDPMSFLLPGLVEPLLSRERFVLAAGPKLAPGARSVVADL